MDLDDAKRAVRQNEARIKARLERIQHLEKELADGRAFVQAWPEREAFLVKEIADNHDKADRYMDRRVKLDRTLSKAETEDQVRRMEEQIARLRREIDAEEKGVKILKAEKHNPPTLDYYGEK